MLRCAVKSAARTLAVRAPRMASSNAGMARSSSSTSSSAAVNTEGPVANSDFQRSSFDGSRPLEHLYADLPTIPAQAHLEEPPSSHKVSEKGRRDVEDDIAAALRSPLFRVEDLSTTPSTLHPDGDDNQPALPPNLVHAPAKRPQFLLQRHRSLSTGSIDKDPFAWLRTTIQEQRERERDNNPSASIYLSPATLDGRSPLSASLPASPMYTTVPVEVEEARRAENEFKQDYFGAGVLSLIAGKEPVRKRLSETGLDGGDSEARPGTQQQGATSSTAQATNSSVLAFNLPSLSSLAPSTLPKASFPTFSTPSLPKWSGPQLPDWNLPSMPAFKAPSLPNADQWMPEALKNKLGANAGEGESRKYMDEDDQANEDEPDWARVKDKYEKPKLPLVFLHGLFGFNVLGPSGMPAFQIQYWRGVREALEQLGVEVLMTTSPPTGNIETRAKAICEQIIEKFSGREINIIGHSMGGLDARYLITHLQPQAFTVRTCTTIATPHRGSAFADFLLEDVLGRRNLPALMSFMQAIQMPGGGHAFDALTRSRMARFNEETPDDPSVKYFSYGASVKPSIVDVFRLPWSIIMEKEGENDGLVSVESSKWGDYQATLENVNHLDLVGWVGRMRYAFAEFTGKGIKFKPVSFYLTIAERLAQEGY